MKNKLILYFRQWGCLILYCISDDNFCAFKLLSVLLISGIVLIIKWFLSMRTDEIFSRNRIVPRKRIIVVSEIIPNCPKLIFSNFPYQSVLWYFATNIMNILNMISTMPGSIGKLHCPKYGIKGVGVVNWYLSIPPQNNSRAVVNNLSPLFYMSSLRLPISYLILKI
jgi:hypothetical protein